MDDNNALLFCDRTNFNAVEMLGPWAGRKTRPTLDPGLMLLLSGRQTEGVALG
jgi:hypothetical protein